MATMVYRTVKYYVGLATKTHSKMADNKKKTGKRDRNLISFRQRYEVAYAVKQLQKQIPGTTKQDAKAALLKAAEEVSPSEKREKAMRAARKILRK